MEKTSRWPPTSGRRFSVCRARYRRSEVGGHLWKSHPSGRVREPTFLISTFPSFGVRRECAGYFINSASGAFTASAQIS
jgi:hypothetical protein